MVKQRFKRKRVLSTEQVLNDWYGDKRGMLEIEIQQQREKKLEEVLDDVMKSIDKDDNVLMRKILDQWEHIVDKAIYHNSTPRKIYNKILYIEVFDAAWRFNLERNFKMEILELIQRISKLRITGIRFIPVGKTRINYS